MKVLLLAKSRLVAILFLLAVGFGPSVGPAAAQFTTNVPPDLGTFSIGEFQWWLTANDGFGSCAWSVVSGTLPPGIVLEHRRPSWVSGSASALLWGVAATPGEYAFTLGATCDGLGSISVATKMKVTALTITEGDNRLPDAFGRFLDYTFSATGSSTGSLTWGHQGELPGTLTITADGRLSGDSGYGEYQVTVTVTDGVDTVARAFNFFSNPADRLFSHVMPNARVGAPYSEQIQSTWQNQLYVISGSLPPGLSIGPTGLVTGTPTGSPGRYVFSVSTAGGNRQLAITVLDDPPLLPTFQPNGGMLDDCTIGVPCRSTLSVYRGGTPPFRWSATGLPAGLRLREEVESSSSVAPGDAEIIGVATELGIFVVDVKVTDATGLSTTNRLRLNVSPMALRVDGGWGTVGQAMSVPLFVLGGKAPQVPSIAMGPLPPGVAFDAGGRLIAGTPIEPGGFHVDFRVEDADDLTLDVSHHFQIGGTVASLWVDGWNNPVVTTGQGHYQNFWACCTMNPVAWTIEGVLPPGLTLSPEGVLSGTATTSGVFTFVVVATDTVDPMSVGKRQVTITVTPLTFNGNPTIPVWNVDRLLSLPLMVNGATGAVTWEVTRYSVLPPGLSITAGVLTGTPTVTGQHDFSLLATDSEGHTLKQSFTLLVYPVGMNPPVSIQTASGLGTWAIGQVWSQLSARGGNGSFTWSLVDGALPPGIAVRNRPDLPSWYGSEANGGLVGVATRVGAYTFTLRVTSGSEHADRTFQVVVTDLRIVNHWTLPEAFKGQPYSYAFRGAGNTGPLTWTTNQVLPAGLTLSPDGELSGTPTEPGWWSFGVNLNADGENVGAGFNIGVYDLRFTTPRVLANALEASPYTARLEADGGTPPYRYSIDGGLPWGLTFDPDTGEISGTVNTGPGQYGFGATVTDATGKSYWRRMSIGVVGEPRRLPSVAPYGGAWNDCTFGVYCSQGISVDNGGVPPFHWEVTGLPEGMFFVWGDELANTWTDPLDAEIAGLPSELGTFNVRVTVTDHEGLSVSNSFPLRVSPMMLQQFEGGGTRGEAFSSKVLIIGGEATGTPPYRATVVSGALPVGLTLNPSTLEVTGTPAENGYFSPWVLITDSAASPQELRLSLGLNIGGGSSTIYAHDSDLGSGVIGSRFSRWLGACCAPTGYKWTAEDSLPAGLTLSEGGELTATALTGAPGPVSFMVRVADAANPLNFGLRRLTLRLTTLAPTTDPVLPYANVNSLYSQTLTTSGASGAVSWYLERGAYLPPGLELSSSGTISGTPTSTGHYSFQLLARDEVGSEMVRTFSIDIYAPGGKPPLSLTMASHYTTPKGVFTVEISESQVSGGTPPYQFSLTPAGELPGVSQVPGMRTITGGPYPSYFRSTSPGGYVGVVAEPGSYTPSIRVTDSTGAYLDRRFTVSVLPFAILFDNQPPKAAKNDWYSFAIPRSETPGTFGWSATNLPPGLTIDGTSGTISGTPTTAGSFGARITLTDLNSGLSVARPYTIQVDPFAIATPALLPSGKATEPYSVTLSAPGCAAPCTWSIAQGSSLPSGLTLSAGTGVISGTTSYSTSARFTVRATAASGEFAERQFGLVIVSKTVQPLYISYVPNSMSEATVGQSVAWGLWAYEGTPPYRWTVDSGALPEGLSLTNDPESVSPWFSAGIAQVYGRFMQAGPYQFTLRVTDAAGASATLPITGNSSLLSLQSTNLPLPGRPLVYKVPYEQPLLLLGGTGVYPSWTIEGSAPAGLTLDPTTGVLGGTPLATGYTSFLVRATDSATSTTLARVSVTVAAPTDKALSLPSLPGTFNLGSNVSNSVAPNGPTGTVPPFIVTATSPLPPGFALVASADNLPGASSAYTLVGVPTTPGTFTFSLEARDSAVPIANVGARAYTITIPGFSALGSGTLPDATAGTPLTLPLVGFGATGSLTWTVASGSVLPPGLTLEGSVLTGTPTTPGKYSFTLAVTDGSGVSSTRNYTLTVSPLRILGDGVLPPLVVGVPYTYTFSAEGGSGTYSWSPAPNTTVPAGLTLTAQGVLSGIRTGRSVGTSAGNSANTITVVASDGTNTVSRQFLLPWLDQNPGVLSIPLSVTQLTDVVVGQLVNVTLNAAEGVPPYSWSVPSGTTLPPGLQLVTGAALPTYAPRTTVLAGIIRTPGTYSFDLVVSDSQDRQARQTYRLRVSPFGFLGTSSPTITAVIGSAFTARFLPSAGAPPFTFAIKAASSSQEMLPPGFSFTPDGVVSGTTTSTGNYSFLLTATDATGQSYSRSYSLVVNNTSPGSSALRVTTGTLAETWVGAAVTRSLALNQSGAATFSVVDALPAGLSLTRNASGTPMVTGTAKSAGVHTFTLRGWLDSNPANVADHQFTLRVGNTQIVTPAWPLPGVLDVPPATEGVPYSFTFGIAGGTPPYSFSESSIEPLPPGLTLSSTGVLSGTPLRRGAYTLYMVVTDASGSTSNQGGLTLIVTPPGQAVPLTRPMGLSQGWVGAPYSVPLDTLLRGGTAPFTWAVTPGSTLPPGIALFPGANGVSAYLGGTPTTPSTPATPTSPAVPYSFYLTVADAGGQLLTTYLTMGVNPMAVTPEVLPPAVVGSPYSQSFLVTGPQGPYTLRLANATDMPPGMSLSESGVLSGTPAAAGIFSLNLQITDGAGISYSKNPRLFVDNALGQVPTVMLSPRRIQVFYEQGAPAPAAVPVAVTTTSGSIPTRLALSAGGWGSLSSVSGSASFTTHLNLNVSGLSPGTYGGHLGVSAPTAVNPGDSVPVTVIVSPAPPCTYSINPFGGSVPNTGGGGTFSIAAGWTCSWTAVSSQPWLTVTTGTSGTGSGTITYTATPNTDPGMRSATITVGGQVYTVSQFGTACSWSISPSELTATSAGGTADVTLTASSPLCGWTASGTTLSVAPNSGTGSGTVRVTVPPNTLPESRVLGATIAGRPFTVTQSGIACTVTLGSPGAGLPSGASAGAVDVVTPAGCSYSTVPGPNWISITSGGSGTGSGTLVYTVEANSTTYPRSGTLTIGGQPFLITQDPLPCSVTLNTTLLGTPYGTAGTTGTIGVAANGANCSWTAASDVPWARLSSDSGTGNRTLTVTIESNAANTTERRGQLSIAGQSLPLIQAGTTCSYSLESESGAASAAGGSAMVRVIAPTPCTWSSSSQASWLTITASGSAGSTAVQFGVAPNQTAVPRSGTLTIAGKTYTVNQAAATCSYTIAGASTSPTLNSAGAPGQSFEFTSVVGGCSPAAVSYANWITIDGTSFAGTAGTVTYSVALNPYGVERRGTIQVGNALYTVVQAGAPCGYSLSSYGRLFHVEGGADTLLASPTAAACTPTAGTDMSSFITLGPLTGPVLNLFSLPYEVAPFPSLTPAVRLGRITLGGQVLTIKQLSW